MDLYHQKIVLYSVLVLSCTVVMFVAWSKSKSPLRKNKLAFNERTKLLATFISNIGTASIVTGLLASVFHGSFLNDEWNAEGVFAVWSLLLGFALHACAQWILGFLHE
jgi:TRAP-type C4-dicarboxylate transport system permease large subunit